MTVNTISSIAEFDTNGVTTNFPFYFKFLANEDLVVTYVDPLGVSSTLTLGTHYSVNGAGNDQGGSIVTTSALAGPGQLVVSREMEAFQQTSLRNQGKFLAEIHEDVFDRLTMLVQQGFAYFKRALTRPFGRDYFYAENRRIKSLLDPVDDQDAATRKSVEVYVAGILETGQGPVNSAANVLYVAPDGTTKTVQAMSGAGGAAMIGYGSATVEEALDAASLRGVNFGNYSAARAYTGNADVVYISGRQSIFDGAHGFWAVHRTGIRPAEDGGTILHLNNSWWITRHYDGVVDPVWFGSTRSTATPTSTGEDITNAKWNAWPSYVNGTTFLAQPGHDWGNAAFLAANKPFSNSDTWDRIAMQLAGWTLKPVSQPDGDYYMSAPIRWHSEMYNTLRGSGIYRCRWHFKDINTHTKLGRVICLLEVFRLGGPPTTFHDFALIGVDSRIPQPDPANAIANVVTGVSCLNTNGVYFRNMWISGGGDIGFLFDTSCSYCFVDYCCVEYMGVSVAVGNASVIYVNNCNLWQSYPSTVPCSAVTGFGTQVGEIFLENNVIVGFTGVIVNSGQHKLTWNGGILRPQTGQPARPGLAISLMTKGSSVKGVNMDLGAGSLSTLILMGSNTVFSSNEVVGRGFTHALMGVSTGVANGATYTRVVDNTFDVTGSFSEGYMITSPISGTSYTGGCTKCLFDGNVVVNQAASTLGWSATNTVGTNQWA